MNSDRKSGYRCGSKFLGILILTAAFGVSGFALVFRIGEFLFDRYIYGAFLKG